MLNQKQAWKEAGTSGHSQSGQTEKEKREGGKGHEEQRQEP